MSELLNRIKNNEERRKRGKVGMVEINPAITNDYTHWIRNTWKSYGWGKGYS